MKRRSARKSLTAVCLLVASLSATPALATWYMDQSDSYYKPQQYYHNNKYGDFPPEDIDQKLFSHLNTENEAEESKSQTDNASVSSNINQQVLNPAQNYSEQNTQQPAYGGNYNRGRNFTSPRKQRHKRNTGFSGPWNSRGSSFSGPWNNNGSSFGGPWNNRGSGFSGPWNNNGSNFSMPWGNNNGSNSSPFGNGGGWSW